MTGLTFLPTTILAAIIFLFLFFAPIFFSFRPAKILFESLPLLKGPWYQFYYTLLITVFVTHFSHSFLLLCAIIHIFLVVIKGLSFVILIKTLNILNLIFLPLTTLVGFLKFLVLFLILTIVIATITLMERKLLALTQRRVGPNYIGYKGRLQFIADAVKLLVKHITVLSKVNRVLFIILPALVLGVTYMMWANLLWGAGLALIEVEYNLLLVGVLSAINSIILTVVGFLTVNKYASLASTRTILVSLTLEIILTFLFVLFAVYSETLCFSLMLSTQERFVVGIAIVLPLTPLVWFTFFLETSRIPFDFAEAESELIAGYTTEYGGFYFALFSLTEYFHLFCFAVIYATCLFGW